MLVAVIAEDYINDICTLNQKERLLLKRFQDSKLDFNLFSSKGLKFKPSYAQVNYPNWFCKYLIASFTLIFSNLSESV